ncbi:hypothetical protein F9K94_15550 [Brucella tritici]|uniref:Uncharacterized protein n=1 Tax=Brucella tritici TaxID=94626 RepID=A0A7V7VSJ0_9HYPH|nr:hypothetical protein [Brucella tritici]KAB2655940.1 hypothetical protein F9K94_15550 [Brucella tritici]
MPSKELIALVAEAIIDNPPVETMTDDEIIIDWSPTAQAAISTILAALQDPTEAMLDECSDGWQYGEVLWPKMLAASALGEQSE